MDEYPTIDVAKDLWNSLSLDEQVYLIKEPTEPLHVTMDNKQILLPMVSRGLFRAAITSSGWTVTRTDLGNVVAGYGIEQQQKVG